MTDKKKAKTNYQNGQVYKIVNSVNDRIYVGSTTQMLCKRMALHRNSAKSQTSNIYTAMREIGVEHFKILLIENFPCQSKAELEAREYAILDTFDKEKCYNSIFNGKMDETARAKMSANNPNKGKLGEDNHLFKRGSIRLYKNGNSQYWRFSWWEDGKQKSKCFNICSKRTAEQAYLAALDVNEKLLQHVFVMLVRSRNHIPCRVKPMAQILREKAAKPPTSLRIDSLVLVRTVFFYKWRNCLRRWSPKRIYVEIIQQEHPVAAALTGILKVEDI
jgi:group I intron endonuclease